MFNYQNIKTVQGERISPSVYKYYPRLASCSLGAVLLLCGVATTLLGIIYAVKEGFENVEKLEVGFILGIIAGSFGIVAGYKKTTCSIATDMVMSIITALSSFGTFLISGSALMELHLVAEETEGYERIVIPTEIQDESSLRTLLLLLMIVSLVEAIVALTSSIITCHFLCFCCKNCCCVYDVTTIDQILFVESAVPLSANEMVIMKPSGDVRQEATYQQGMGDDVPPAYYPSKI